ncbi:hypothetical protein BC828DRAFT_410119, partial [Blastocladiella britannica]
MGDNAAVPDELDTRIRDVFDANEDKFGARVGGEHLSRIFAYEAINLQTAYGNNIKVHFPTYVTRCTRALATAATRDFLAPLPANHPPPAAGPPGTAKPPRIQRPAVQDRPQPEPPALPALHGAHESVLQVDPAAKLLSPLPLRTHLIPRHIRLDTAALIDLWDLEAENRQAFLGRLWFALEELCPGRNFELDLITTKDTLKHGNAVWTEGAALPRLVQDCRLDGPYQVVGRASSSCSSSPARGDAIDMGGSWHGSAQGRTDQPT